MANNSLKNRGFEIEPPSVGGYEIEPPASSGGYEIESPSFGQPQPSFLERYTSIKPDTIPEAPGIIDSVKETIPKFSRDKNYWDVAENLAKTAAFPIAAPLAAGGSAIRKIPGVNTALEIARRGASGVAETIGTGDIQKGTEAIRSGKPFSRSVREAVDRFATQDPNFSVDNYRDPSLFRQFVIRLPGEIAGAFADFIDPAQIPTITAATGIAAIPKVKAKLPQTVARALVGEATKMAETKMRMAGYDEGTIGEFRDRVEMASKGDNLDVRKAWDLLKKAQKEDVKPPARPQIETPPEPMPAAEATPRPAEPAPTSPLVPPANPPAPELMEAMAKKYGDQAPFLMPGYGIETGTTRMTVTAKKLAGVFHVTSMAVTDGMTKAATAFQEALANGLPEDKAMQLANVEFWKGIPLQSALMQRGVFQNDPELLANFIGSIKTGDPIATQQFVESLVLTDPELKGLFPGIEASQLERQTAESYAADQVTAEKTRQKESRLAAKGPAGIVDFVKGMGGINPTLPESSDIAALEHRDLINSKSGTSLPKAVQSAIESGYLEPGATNRELLDALDAEKRTGNKIYSKGDMSEGYDRQDLPEPANMKALSVDKEVKDLQSRLGSLRKAEQMRLSELLDEKGRRDEFERQKDEEEFAKFSKEIDAVAAGPEFAEKVPEPTPLEATAPEQATPSELEASTPIKTEITPPLVKESYVTTKIEEAGFMETTSMKIEKPEDVVSIFYHLKNDTKENFYFTLLDAENRIIGIQHNSIGTINYVSMHMREIMTLAKKAGAVKIIPTHNHPSGRVSPSQADLDGTKLLKKHAREMGIEVGDHVIIDHGKYGIIDAAGKVSEASFVEPTARPLKAKLLRVAQETKHRGVYEGRSISTPEKIAEIMKELVNKDKDTLFALVMDSTYQINAIVPIATAKAFGLEVIDPIRNAVMNFNGARIALASGKEIGPDIVWGINKKLDGLGARIVEAISPNADFTDFYSMRMSHPGAFGTNFSENEIGFGEAKTENDRKRLIASAQIMKTQMKLAEIDWTKLKQKAVKKLSLTQMDHAEIKKVIEIMKAIKAGKFNLKDYLAGPYDFKTPAPPPPKPMLTDAEKWFGQRDTFPDVGFPAAGEKPGALYQAGTFVGARSRGKILKDAKEAGKAFFKEIESALSLPTYKSGEFNAALKKISDKVTLSKDEIFNLKESLEGREKPKNDNVRTYFDELDKQRKQIQSLRQQQIDGDPFQMSLEIKRKQKELWGLKNYFHHHIPSADDLGSGKVRDEIIEDMVLRKDVGTKEQAAQLVDEYVSYLKNQKTPQKLIEWLVKSGQAANVEDAALKLQRARQFNRRFEEGAFLPREIDLPFYDPNPLRVVPNYNSRALQYIYNVERFGEGAQKLLALIEKIDMAGGSREVANTVLDYVMGRSKHTDTENLSQWLRNFQVIEKMSFSALSNFFQGSLGTSLVFGPRTAVKTKLYIRSHSKEAIEWATRVGQNPDMALLFSEDLAGAAKKFLNMTGFRRTETGNYVFATNAGRVAGEHFLNRLKKNPKDAYARKRLEVLRIDPDKALGRGFLDETDLLNAGNYGWRESQAIPNILNMPHKWLGVETNSEFGRLLMQFKSVAYNQTRLIWEHAIKEAAHGRVSGLLTMLILFPAVGEIIQGIRSLLQGKDRPENLVDRYMEDLGATFGFGVLSDFYYWSKFGTISFGPTMTQAAELLSAAGEVTGIKKGYSSTKRQARNLPFVGPYLYNKYLKKQPGEGKSLRSRIRGMAKKKDSGL